MKEKKLTKTKVDFTNILRADAKNANKTDGLIVFFVLLGSACIKAARKMLVILIPSYFQQDRNFSNQTFYLTSKFKPECFSLQSKTRFLWVQFWKVKLLLLLSRADIITKHVFAVDTWKGVLVVRSVCDRPIRCKKTPLKVPKAIFLSLTLGLKPERLDCFGEIGWMLKFEKFEFII
jgi:hypothetical protein